MRQNDMNLKELFRKKSFLQMLMSEVKFISKSKEFHSGMIYTFYSDKLDLIEVGFARNNYIIEDKMNKTQSILLDKRIGRKTDLLLLKETLKNLGVVSLSKNLYEHSSKTMRYLKILGWPIGNSLYKQKIIKKKFNYVIT